MYNRIYYFPSYASLGSFVETLLIIVLLKVLSFEEIGKRDSDGGWFIRKRLDVSEREKKCPLGHHFSFNRLAAG